MASDITALSRRETQCAKRLSQGLSAGQIAADLGVTRAVAKNYLRRAARKLGLKGQGEVASFAAEHLACDAEELTLP